jgi:hypothetical protein
VAEADGATDRSAVIVDLRDMITPDGEVDADGSWSS